MRLVKSSGNASARSSNRESCGRFYQVSPEPMAHASLEAVPESMGEDCLHGLAIAEVVSTEHPRNEVLQMMQCSRSVMDEDAGGDGKARKSLFR